MLQAVSPFSNAGFAYRELNKPQEALNYFEKALEVDPNLSEAYLGKSFVYLKLGKHELAMDDFLSHLSLQPDSAYGWYALALAYFNNQDEEKCKSTTKRGVELIEKWEKIDGGHIFFFNPRIYSLFYS